MSRTTWPTSPVFFDQENNGPGGTLATAQWANKVGSLLQDIQDVVGLAGDSEFLTTVLGRINKLEKRSAHITIGTVSPGDPQEGELFIDTTVPEFAEFRGYFDHSWEVIAADATYIRGLRVPDSTPSNAQVLAYDSPTGTLVYRDESFINPLTATGDIAIGGTVVGGLATPGRLPKGAEGQIITVFGGAVIWRDPPPSGIPNTAITANGQILYRDNSAVVGGLNIGTVGQKMTVSSSLLPSWTDDTSIHNVMTQPGDILVGGAIVSGLATPTRLPIGPEGYIPRVVNGLLAYTPDIGGLGRVKSGILFHDSFDRSNRSLAGDNNWGFLAGVDQGDWEIISNLVTNLTPSNYDRIHNTTAGTLANCVVEMKARDADVNSYLSIATNVQATGFDDYGMFFRNNEVSLYRAGTGLIGSDPTPPTMTASQYYHLKMKVADSGANKQITAWLDRVQRVTATTAIVIPPGWPGLLFYGGTSVEVDDFIAYTDTVITVAGLSGTQGFQLYDASNALKGSSAAQSGGKATLDTATLIDCPFTGYIQVFEDAGTWAVTTVAGRFPGASTDSNICGGDLYVQGVGGASGGGGGGSGTVTSVSLTAPSIFSVTGSPITTSGILAISLNTQTANRVWAGPGSGAAAAPAFRALVPADLPIFVGSGGSHAIGAVPDAGASAGTSRYLREDGTWVAPAGAGTVTSVALSMPSLFSVTGSPITGAGTLAATLATQAANLLLAGPTSGGVATPAFRALVDADLPSVLVANARVGVRRNTGATTYTRRRVNLIEGANVTISCSDDAVDEEVDVTIASSGGGGSASHDHTASDGSGILTGDEHDSYSQYDEIATPGTPPGNSVWLYAKDKSGVSCLYFKSDAGVEHDLSSGGTGTVTSVALAMPSIFSVSGSPVTASGTLTAALATQSPNFFLAGPLSGVAATPTFRAIAPADIPPFGPSGAGHAVGGVPDPGATAGATRYLREDSNWVTPAGSGTVTSVALTMPSIFSVAGSPVTAAGTLAATLATQAANIVFAGPVSGGVATPAFRALVSADIPVMHASGGSHSSGAAPDPGSTAGTTRFLREDATWQVVGGEVTLTPYHIVSAASVNDTLVDATARKLGLVACYNNNASPRYLKIYDKATAPVAGTDTPVLTIEIPGNSTNGAGNNLPIPNPIGLSNGLGFALTTGNADSDTGAVAAGDIVVNLGWSV